MKIKMSSSKWFDKDGKYYKVTLEKITRYMQAVNKPTYLGFISLEIRLSLAQTQSLVDDLVASGVLKALSSEEKIAYELDPRGNIYALVKNAK